LEVGGEGGFKLDLRQDCDPGRQGHDPGKWKLKGAVRTETPLLPTFLPFLFVKEGGALCSLWLLRAGKGQCRGREG
jgi:hypothetical protein